jgi:glutamate synthase (NADPH/NADH) large chain
MSGGRAFVWKLDRARVNPELVDLRPASAGSAGSAAAPAMQLHALVRRHLAETGSAVADALLADWDSSLAQFTEVVPRDYQRVTEAMRAAEAAGRDVNAAVMEVARA